jgi:hypothetical protein
MSLRVAERREAKLRKALRHVVDVLAMFRHAQDCPACDQPVYTDDGVAPHLPDCAMVAAREALAEAGE